MPTNFLSNITHLTTPTLDTIDDAFIGSSVSTGTGAQPYPGQLGAIFTMNNAEAARAGKNNTLFQGTYQYVQFKSGSTAANARGQIVFWSDVNNYIVTPDAVAANLGCWAGITLNAVTKGNFGWIQVWGQAGVLFVASITKATPAACDMVVVDATPSNKADVLADATGVTWATLRLKLGVAEEAPAGGAVKLVELCWNIFNP
jgi:hypothetical protein